MYQIMLNYKCVQLQTQHALKMLVYSGFKKRLKKTSLVSNVKKKNSLHMFTLHHQQAAICVCIPCYTAEKCMAVRILMFRSRLCVIQSLLEIQLIRYFSFLIRKKYDQYSSWAWLEVNWNDIEIKECADQLCGMVKYGLAEDYTHVNSSIEKLWSYAVLAIFIYFVFALCLRTIPEFQLFLRCVQIGIVVLKTLLSDRNNPLVKLS